VLGLVSLLNDAASEMITPLLPIFLTATLGAGPAIVGFVEGLAEATASVLKLVSGRLADRGVPAKGLVLGGYGISNACRPLIGLATGWLAVLLLRFLDRVGKGLRTAPRDAFIALGYAGWDAGQLEQEIKDNAWLTLPVSDSLLFDLPYEARWLAAWRQIGVDVASVSAVPGHA
jgi:hypothetical protein